MAAVETLP